MNADASTPHNNANNNDSTTKKLQLTMTSEDHIQLLLRRYLKNKSDQAKS